MGDKLEGCHAVGALGGVAWRESSVVGHHGRHGGLVQVRKLLWPKSVAIELGWLVGASKKIVNLVVIKAVIVFGIKEAGGIRCRRA